MGDAKRRGTYEERKASPRGKVPTPKLPDGVRLTKRSRDGRSEYASNGRGGLRRVR